MFERHRVAQFKAYTLARRYFLKNPQALLDLEEYLTTAVIETIIKYRDEIERDYNEAGYLFPFWQNYPPDDRGRQPKGDQYPWIEVGEHAIGAKLPRLLIERFAIRDTGFPTGADTRVVVETPKIKKITHGLTDSAWLFIDVKSVGPRDDAPHAVMSHNQISGDGVWDKPEHGIRNTILQAIGSRANHDFHCSLPPLFVLSDATVAPLVTLALKPVYGMMPGTSGLRNAGQPLQRIVVACIPNGLLLTLNPAYLKTYPSLLFPGKDDKGKDPRKLRARVSFELLQKLGDWRVQTVSFESS